jgi:hypothetical protein
MAIDLTPQLTTLSNIYLAEGKPLPSPAVVVSQDDAQISLSVTTPKGRPINVTLGVALTPTQILSQLLQLIEQTDAL